MGIHQKKGSGANGVLEAYLAVGDAAFGAPFASSSAQSFTTAASKFTFGATNGNAQDAIYDDILLDSAVMPGPSLPPPTATPTSTATPTNTATPTATSTPAPSAPPAYDQTYAYDALGNLTSKAGVTYTYGPIGSGPHQARNVGGQIYSYDANGNLMSGGGRTYAWNADNLPATVTSGSVTETYTYDADGERVAKTVGSTTTIYFQGIWEQIVGGASTRYYTFNGQVVAMRDSATNAVTYLHGDHLGSVSLATNSSGAVVSSQDFDPWGKVRSGGVGATSLNYTGQRLDGTGLLYYHARYYDPALARFVSADTVVPGVGALAIAPSDATSAALFREGGKDRDGNPTAPQNPQTLNRYSYVENNPVSKNDPSGHCSGGGTWNNFVSVFNGTCFQKGMFIMAHAKTPGDWALGAFAAVGPSAAIAMLVAGTLGLGAAAIGGITAADSAAVIPMVSAISNAGSKIVEKVQFPLKSLQHAFSGHARDFGISGSWNKANAASFEQSLEKHMSGANTVIIQGTYRGTQQVYHFYNPATNLWSATDLDGNLVAAWRLGQAQALNLLKNGNVQ